MSTTIIRNGRIIDPTNKRDGIADLYISNGKVVGSKSEIRAELTRRDGKTEIEEIDAKGLIVAPRFDRHACAPARARIQSQGDD